jgi:hypothetical protein
MILPYRDVVTLIYALDFVIYQSDRKIRYPKKNRFCYLTADTILSNSDPIIYIYGYYPI